MMMKKHISHLPFILAKLGAVSFTVCFLWQFALPADVHEFHMMFMRMSVLGFSGFNLLSFILGVLQWVVWGLLVGCYVAWLRRYLWKKCPHDDWMENCCMTGGMKKEEPPAIEHSA